VFKEAPGEVRFPGLPFTLRTTQRHARADHSPAAVDAGFAVRSPAYTLIAWSAAESSPRQMRRDVQSSAGLLQKASDGPSPNGRNTQAHRYRLPVEM
jgi:hypothetical protein